MSDRAKLITGVLVAVAGCIVVAIICSAAWASRPPAAGVQTTIPGSGQVVRFVTRGTTRTGIQLKPGLLPAAIAGAIASIVILFAPTRARRWLCAVAAAAIVAALVQAAIPVHVTETLNGGVSFVPVAPTGARWAAIVAGVIALDGIWVAWGPARQVETIALPEGAPSEAERGVWE